LNTKADVQYAITAALRNADKKGSSQVICHMKDAYKTREQLINELRTLRKSIAKMERAKCKFEEAEERLHKKLTEHEKLSALGRLTANVAHEIRNPITVIGGFAERLNKNIPSGAKEKEYVELISLEVKRLEDILRDVLLFSNKPFFIKKKLDINRVAVESLNAYKIVCNQRSISIQRSFGEVTPVYADKKHIKEAINNLISNAIDAMPQGGVLAIETNEESMNRKNYVTLKIADTGIGIPEKNLNFIFEPFFTTKVTKEETGLGLSICKKIVEGHGGFIKVDSSAGKGSVFSLYFPYRSQ